MLRLKRTQVLLAAVFAVLLFNSVVPHHAQELGDQDFVAGPKIMVNQFTGTTKNDPAVSIGADGALVVVWERAGAINGQRLDAHLQHVGSTFVVSNDTQYSFQPDVCADANGDFVATWRNDSVDEIRVRRNKTGSFQGVQMVNTYATGSRSEAAIDCTTADDFVVSWRGQADGNFDTIAGRIFSSGAGVGDEFQVSSSANNPASGPDIGLNSAGDFVVVWLQDDFDSDARSQDRIRASSRTVDMRRFSQDGTALGLQVVVDSDPYSNSRPRVDREKEQPGGDFVVVWEESGIGNTVETALYTNQGALAASNSFVPAGIFTSNIQPLGVFAGPGGAFVVGAFDRSGTMAFQRYEDPLASSGDSFQLSNSNGYNWDMAGRADGSFVVVWPEYNEIFAQQFIPALFADGFESGDTNEWSDSTP